MGNYIEFIGVPGVGKSTTYKFLKNYSNEELWIPYEKLRKLGETTDKSLKNSVLRYLIKQIRPNEVKRSGLNRTFLNNAVNEHPKLVELFWKTIPNINDKNGEELKFYGVEYIQNILEKIQFIKEYQTEKLCLVDEGLLHNLGYFTPDNGENSETLIKKMLDYIYLPKAVIYFTGDVHVIVDRTISRGNPRLRDKNLTHAQLIDSRLDAIKEKEQCIKAIENLIPVLYLDAMESLDLKAEKIRSFINELE